MLFFFFVVCDFVMNLCQVKVKLFLTSGSVKGDWDKTRIIILCPTVHQKKVSEDLSEIVCLLRLEASVWRWIIK